MNRILILIIFIISITSSSIAEVINNLNVKGNNRVSKETIILFGGLAIAGVVAVVYFANRGSGNKAKASA